MIKAIIFDCFGVLAVDGWTPFKEKHFGHDQKLLNRAVDLNKQTDAGMLDYDDYVKEIANMAGVEPIEFRAQIERMVIDGRLLKLVSAELKPKYKIGMLSNVASDWLKLKLPKEQLELFDVIALSSETGLAKPNTAAYQNILAELGVQPDQAIFTDDQPIYCEAATALGISAITYKSFNQFKKELNKLL